MNITLIKFQFLLKCFHLVYNVHFESYSEFVRLKGSVTVCYIYVHCLFMSLFAKYSIRLRYIKIYIGLLIRL